MSSNLVKIGIVTVSDRASRGEYPDRSGPAVREFFERRLACPWEAVSRLIPDEQAEVERTLRDLCDRKACCLVVTTGGTGPAARDITPDATGAVCDKMLPGFGERMRSVSLETVPTAMLSRQTAGIRAHTLILNLPGKPAAIALCLDAVLPAVPHCLELIGGPALEIR